MQRTCCLLSRLAVLNAANGIGSALTMLLATSPLVSTLSLYDAATTDSHIMQNAFIMPVPAKVTRHNEDSLHDSVHNTDLVLVLPCGRSRPGMTRDDLFNTNASIVRDLVRAVGEAAPTAIIGIISNPVNSTVPIAAETLKKMGVYDKNRLFGVTTLDLVRARTFVAEALGKLPGEVDVPVIGGHSGETIVPLLSAYPKLKPETVKSLTHRIQFGGDNQSGVHEPIVQDTDLSTAYAISEWCLSILRALRGDLGVVEYSYVENDVQPGVTFFSCACELGPKGIVKRQPMPQLNGYEQELLQNALPALQADIKRGIDYVHSTP